MSSITKITSLATQPLTLAVVVYTEDQTDASALELSKKRTVLAGFCKLIAYNVIDLKLVSPVFAFLIKV